MALAFNIVIPARYGASRLPGKPLLPLAGRPMIAHVLERAQAAGAERVVVATDDPRIAEAVRAMGGEALLTHAGHQSGTERANEVAGRCGWPDHTLIVNLQGDEPLVPPALIRTVAAALAGQRRACVATLAALAGHDDIFNPNAVKVVVDKDGYALYFSRAPVPWERGAFGTGGGQPSGACPHYRHIGLYAYTAGFLRRYCQWPPAPLEQAEALEQLRMLWQGEAVFVRQVDTPPPAGVDTADDLARVERLLAARHAAEGPLNG